MQKPRIDFFVIGAARCGTTSFYRILQQHSGAFTPEVKEPRFFNENWSKGWDWYASLYEGAPENTIRGDFSPSYSNSPSKYIASRIHQHYPDAKIVYCVRNPIDCAVSNWRMRAEIIGSSLPFAEAIQDDEWRSVLVDRARFFQQISYFREFYPDEQIKIIPLEIAKHGPPNDTLEWLGLAPVVNGRFPKANASDRKPGRPGKPKVDNPTRNRFIVEVKDDAKAFLDYAGLPASLWPLSVNYRGWEDTRPFEI